MKKRLILRVTLFLALVGIVLALVNTYYYGAKLSPIWGDKYLIGKQNTLYKNKNRYNTLFLGSSKTHYQIIPAKFDSIVNAAGGDSVHSYNFGIDGMLPPESFYVCRQLLEDDRLKLKNLVIELNFVKAMERHNAFTWRGIYWINSDTYADYTAAIWHSPTSSTKFRFQNLAMLNAMALRKLLHPSKFRIVNYYRTKRTNTDSTAMYSGFEPLVREQEFRALDSAQINKLATYSKEAFANYDNWSLLPLNEAFLNQVNQITELAESKGIRVYYYFHAQWSIELYKELLPILKRLPANSKLMVADINKIGPLFKSEYLFDSEHVSGEGAKLFTNYLAKEFTTARVMK